MPRRCACDRVEDCHLCRLYHTRPDYRAYWDTAVTLPGECGPCRHLGGEVRREDCQSCAGRVRLLVFACRVFGECTLATRTADVPGCCAGCPAYEPRA